MTRVCTPLDSVEIPTMKQVYHTKAPLMDDTHERAFLAPVDKRNDAHSHLNDNVHIERNKNYCMSMENMGVKI